MTLPTTPTTITKMETNTETETTAGTLSAPPAHSTFYLLLIDRFQLTNLLPLFQFQVTRPAPNHSQSTPANQQFQDLLQTLLVVVLQTTIIKPPPLASQQPSHKNHIVRVSRLSDHANTARERNSRVTATDHRRHGRHVYRRRETNRNSTNADGRTNTRLVRLPGHVDSEANDRAAPEHRMDGPQLVQPPTAARTTTGTVLASAHD